MEFSSLPNLKLPGIIEKGNTGGTIMEEKLNKRQQQALQTKEKIRQAGIRLFREKGYEDTKISDICKEAGVAYGNFYHYFPNKDYLYLSMYLSFDAFVEKVLSKRSYPSNLEAIRYLMWLQFSSDELLTLEDQRQRFQAQLNVHGGYVVEETRSVHIYVKELLRKGIEAGEIDPSHDVEHTAQLIFQVARGVLFDWAMRGGTFSKAGQLDLALDLFLSSLTRPREKTSAPAVDFEEYIRWKEDYYEEQGWR